MDLHSRKIVGWSMRNDLEVPLVVDAISMAIARRRPAAGLVHHSDRGSQGSTARLRWAARYATRRSWPAWARRATPGTTPRRRAASRRSRTSSSSAGRSRPKTRRGSRSSATSKPSTTRCAGTPASACSAPTSTRTDTGRRPLQPSLPRKTVSTETGQPHRERPEPNTPRLTLSTPRSSRRHGPFGDQRASQFVGSSISSSTGTRKNSSRAPLLPMRVSC